MNNVLYNNSENKFKIKKTQNNDYLKTGYQQKLKADCFLYFMFYCTQ